MTKKSEKSNGAAHGSEGEFPELPKDGNFPDLPDINEDPVKMKLAEETERTQKDIDRLSVINSELSVLRGQIQGIERKRPTYAAALEAAIAERRTYAFGAENGDPAAVARLKAGRAAQLEAALVLEDLDSAIAAGRETFDALELERDQLAPSGPWHDAVALAKDLLEKDGEKIDFHLSGFVEALRGHQERLEMLKMLARDSGHEASFRTCGSRHLLRVFSTKMCEISPLEFERFPAYRGKTYGEILRMQIANGIGVSLDVESESGATEPATAPQAEEIAAGV